MPVVFFFICNLTIILTEYYRLRHTCMLSGNSCPAHVIVCPARNFNNASLRSPTYGCCKIISNHVDSRVSIRCPQKWQGIYISIKGKQAVPLLPHIYILLQSCFKFKTSSWLKNFAHQVAQGLFMQRQLKMLLLNFNRYLKSSMETHKEKAAPRLAVMTCDEDHPRHFYRRIVKPQWLEHLWDHRNLFETWVVRATEG